MRERAESILRIIAGGLAVFLLVQGVRHLRSPVPLTLARIPEIPTWQDSETNAPPAPSLPGPPTAPIRRGGPMPGPAPGSAHPPEIQQRLDRITQSGLLGPIIQPPPMALLGIAGEHALIRSPSGQTGLIKEGEELGGVKLLRIGINRVLVEEAGTTKELSIFEGLGGESLVGPANPPTP